jgi:hypothetical protein
MGHSLFRVPVGKVRARGSSLFCSTSRTGDEEAGKEDIVIGLNRQLRRDVDRSARRRIRFRGIDIRDLAPVAFSASAVFELTSSKDPVTPP